MKHRESRNLVNMAWISYIILQGTQFLLNACWIEIRIIVLNTF